MEPVAEATEEESFDTSPALFSKLLIRRCHIGSLKENLLSAKTTTKTLLKPSFELVALVILRVPPVLTVALLNLLSSKQRTSPSAVVVSSSRSASCLGFLGWQPGATRNRLALTMLL